MVHRGWTYQEGVLSRRRLVFTDEQVYYECAGMYCYESLNVPLSDLHTKDGQQFQSQYCEGYLDTGIFPNRFGESPFEAIHRINQYSNRSLSDPSDILRGLLGILRALEQGRHKIRHVMGVPILPGYPDWHSLTQKDWDGLDGLPRSISCLPTIGFCLGLLWDVDKPLTRRVGFPSWSWAGWAGKIKWGWGEDGISHGARSRAMKMCKCGSSSKTGASYP
jgi:hypothetical protein